MQTVQDWLNKSASDKPQQSGALKSVSEWMTAQPATTPAPVAPPPAPTEPGYIDQAITKTKDYANESADVARAFPDKVLHPVRSFMNFTDTMKSEWIAGVTKAGTPVDNGNFVTDISNLITGVAQASFSPVTALFKAADAIPGIKQAADAINLPFVALGLGGSWVAEKVVNVLPDSVASKETKEVIMQPLQELGGLTAQLLFGAKVMERLGEFSKTKKKGEKITPEEATKVVAEVKKEMPATEPVSAQPKAMSVKEWTESGMPKAPERPISETSSYPYSIKNKGYDTVYHQTTPEAAKSLTFGYGDRSGLFVSPSKDLALGQKGNGALIEFDATRIESRKGGRPDLNGNPSEFEILKAPDRLTKDVKSVIFDKEPKGGFGDWLKETTQDNKIKYTNPEYVSKQSVAKPVESIKAPELIPETQIKKVADEQFNSKVYERMKNENPELTGDAKYTPISLKEDAARASDLLVKDRQEAFDIAMGKKASPDVTSTSVNIVMAEKALADGNVELFSRLTKKRSLDQTRRGQEIVSEKSSISDNSVSRYVRELIETRLNLLGNSYLGKAVEFATKQSPKQKATKIIDSEVAKLTTKINGKKLDVKTALDLLDKLKCV